MATKTKKNSTLYVINASPSRLLIPYTDRNGRDHCLLLPPTWIPIDVTLQGSRRDIINAPNFKNAQNLKLLKLVDEDDAIKMLKSSDAKQEHDRIYTVADNIGLNGEQTVEIVGDTNDEVLLLSVTELTDHTAQKNRFRTMLNSGLMTPSLAKMIKKSIKTEPDKSKRNRGLFDLCNEYLEDQED